MLRPALDAIPALAMGGILSLALTLHGLYDLLPGTWMSLYGLAQVAYRQSMPPAIYRVGLGYIVAGTAMLLCPAADFLSPWPMGVVFFIGECLGGAALIINQNRGEPHEET